MFNLQRILLFHLLEDRQARFRLQTSIDKAINMMNDLFRKIDWKPTLISAAVAAICFAIAVGIFIYWSRYDQTWILYLGSFAFLIVMFYHIIHDSKLRGNNESTVALVFSSHVATIIGVILATALSFILLAIFVPGYIGSGSADVQQQGEPANVLKDNTDGLAFQIFLAATVINFSVGSFCGIIVPFTIKKNQMRDSKDPAPLHQGGSR
jgi:hypothetical protein